jgi:hypothetical protein
MKNASRRFLAAWLNNAFSPGGKCFLELIATITEKQNH